MNAARSRVSGARSTSLPVLIGSGGQATGPSSVMAGNLPRARRAGASDHRHKIRSIQNPEYAGDIGREKLTEQWPKYGRAWYIQPTIASVYTAEQIADTLLADAAFRALRLGTWLSTPPGELVGAAVTALAPPPYQEDVDLLIEALQLAAQR